MKNWLLTKIKETPHLALVLGFIALFFFVQLFFLIFGSNRCFAPFGRHSILIKPGMTTEDISKILHHKNLVRRPAIFQAQARLKGLARRLQAGLYLIRGGMHNEDIINLLSKGKVQMAQITVPEGFTVAQVANVLQSSGLGNAAKFRSLAKNLTLYDYMKPKSSKVLFRAEGFLYPAVYDFPASYDEKDILEMMVRKFHEEMENANALESAREQDFNFHDVVTLASLVEKEAVFEEEQPLIAGIFLRRLKIGMPLQSDTTVQYILGGKQRDIIYYKDTEINHPYNTYQNYGLPPGPIASPGLSAIKAVLQPMKSNYLYFVAQKDGHHRFTTNYAAHLKAIRDIENGR